MVGANPGFVREVDQRPLALGPCGNLRVILGAPALHQCRVLLPRPVQRALGRKSQTAHQPPHRHLAQADGKVPANQFPDHRQRPQGKLKVQLQRVLGANDAGKLLHLLSVELGRCARNRLGLQSRLAAIVKRFHPAIDGAPVDAQPRGNKFRTLTGFDPLDRRHSQLLLCLARQLPPVEDLLAFHAQNYPRNRS